MTFILFSLNLARYLNMGQNFDFLYGIWSSQERPKSPPKIALELFQNGSPQFWFPFLLYSRPWILSAHPWCTKWEDTKVVQKGMLIRSPHLRDQHWSEKPELRGKLNIWNSAHTAINHTRNECVESENEVSEHGTTSVRGEILKIALSHVFL